MPTSPEPGDLSTFIWRYEYEPRSRRRWATLIDDLRAYTRAGVVENDRATADSSVVLEQALSSLAEAVRLSECKVTYHSLPEVRMSQAHLQQVFQNLIGNALKYRKEDPPEIHISASHEAAAWRSSIRDNGIGIDPENKEKIFGVFKRLHRDQKYSGTGMGPAICQRVVGYGVPNLGEILSRGRSYIPTSAPSRPPSPFGDH